jgi:RNA polymerase sigma-70 factor (ECF subfamily)
VVGEDEWKVWLDRHGDSLLLLARQWGVSATDAEDILQDAFFNFWAHRRSVVSPAAYLFRAVRNAAIDFGRRSFARQKRDRLAGLDAANAVAAPCYERGGDSSERQRAIETALSALPAAQREVLVMKIWAGLTFDEIGKVAGVSANTAASRYRYALMSLRRHLDPELVHG